MYAKFRIGYAYARAKDNQKEAVVILKKCAEPGFNKVSYQGKEYTISSLDEGPKIICNQATGLKGELLESNDERASIIKGASFCGQGISMQLALALAVCANYEEGKEDDLPIILFSGAISCEKENFAGAKIIPDYQVKRGIDEEMLEKTLLSKYNATKMVSAVGIVFVKEHAKLLTEKLGKEYCNLCNLDLSKRNEDPFIIGVDASELPDLAEMLGIDSSHYKKNAHNDVLGGILTQTEYGVFVCANCGEKKEVLYFLAENKIEKDFTIGREGCDLNLKENNVISRKHITIKYANGLLEVTDHSRNNTNVEGTLLTENQSITIKRPSLICLAPRRKDKVYVKLRLGKNDEEKVDSTQSENEQHELKCTKCKFVTMSDKKIVSYVGEDVDDRSR